MNNPNKIGIYISGLGQHTLEWSKNWKTFKDLPHSYKLGFNSWQNYLNLDNIKLTM